MKNRIRKVSSLATLFSAIIILQAHVQNASGQSDYPCANPKKELEKISWLEKTKRSSDDIWRTKYDKSKPEHSYDAPIVRYAGKWTRHQFGGHGGMSSNCGWRYAAGQLVPRKPWQDIGQVFTDKIDVDGDGDLKDDFVFSLPFSMDVPLGIPDWPAASVFPERLNSTFYGGITFYCANNTPDKLNNFSGEMGVNPDHSCFPDSRAEDHPINGYRHKSIPGSFLKHYVAMIWKKEDFLNGGDKFRVSFDDKSRLVTFCTRGYWYGWNDVRYIVRNKDKFYISEIMPEIPDYPFKDAKRLGKKPGYLPICHPTKTKWAPYNPEGFKIDFDPTSANFANVLFDDVTAVGWYLAKTDKSDAQTHCKWYGFDADAVVNSPAEPSPNIEMAEINGAGVPDFYISTCEVPYSLWQDICRYGDSPWNVTEARYVYDKSGSMGSMAYGSRSHCHDEPVTDLTFYDILALCNTLSEMEGRTPCYYLDPEFKTVFRNQHIQTRADHGDKAAAEVRNFQTPICHDQPLPKIYVEWAADGHRLPTDEEWKSAAGDLKEQVSQFKASDGTKPVGSGKGNSKGVYDLIGNVWEPVWNFGDNYDPEKDAPATVLGGDFNYPSSPVEKTMSPYGDRPFSGNANVGVRLVRREKDLAKTPMGAAQAKSGADMSAIPPVWTFKKDEIVGKKEAPKTAKPVVESVKIPGGAYVRHDGKTVKVAPFEMAKYLTTYDLWNKVKQWGEAHGYDFDRSGDMGSMFFFDFTHTPDEPVTNLTWFDMIVWCNALSEMEGRAPCYYYDEACTQVIRKAFDFNPIKLNSWEWIDLDESPLEKYLWGPYATPWIFTRWDTDGYRLATAAEYDYAIRGGTKTKYFWGDEPEKAGEYMWDAKNSEGRSHPVGQKKPNPYGLYDIQGNVFEMTFSCADHDDKNRPYEEDLDNPIHSSYYGYKLPKKEFAPKSKKGILAGPSFLHGGFNINGQHGVFVESSPDTGETHYYPDIGFRVVRCEPGTHPKDGLRPIARKEAPKKMKIDGKKFNDLKR